MTAPLILGRKRIGKCRAEKMATSSIDHRCQRRHYPGPVARAGRVRRLDHEASRIRGRSGCAPPRDKKAGPSRLPATALSPSRSAAPWRASMSARTSPTATRTYRTAWRRSLASHCGGVGLRALSIVDLAAWDVAAKLADRSIAEFVGGAARPMPATAIIGYPPATVDAQMIGRQVRELADAGWNRFKAPIAPTFESSAARSAGGAGGGARVPGSAATPPGCSTTSTRPRNSPARSTT